MCHALLQTPAFFALLRRIDEDLMKVARDRGCCHCGSVLHSANYPRKPRGCPPAAHPDCNTRLSLCCAGCRKRMTPDSVRFLGRRVWLAIVLVLRSSRATGACLDGLPATEMRRYMPWPEMQSEILRWYEAGSRSLGFLVCLLGLDLAVNRIFERDECRRDPLGLGVD